MLDERHWGRGSKSAAVGENQDEDEEKIHDNGLESPSLGASSVLIALTALVSTVV